MTSSWHLSLLRADSSRQDALALLDGESSLPEKGGGEEWKGQDRTLSHSVRSRASRNILLFCLFLQLARKEAVEVFNAQTS